MRVRIALWQPWKQQSPASDLTRALLVLVSLHLLLRHDHGHHFPVSVAGLEAVLDVPGSGPLDGEIAV